MHAANVSIVGDEGNPPRPPAGTDESEPSPDDRAQPVSADDDVGEKITGIRAAGPYSGNPSGGIAQHVDDTHAFDYSSASLARSLQQNCIEHGPPHCQPPVTVSTISVIREELTVDGSLIGRMHAHPRELSGAGAFDGAQRAHLLQDS